MPRFRSSEHIVALAMALTAIMILRLANAISADAAETQLTAIIGAIVGSGAMAVGQKLGNGSGKYVDVNADINVNKDGKDTPDE